MGRRKQFGNGMENLERREVFSVAPGMGGLAGGFRIELGEIESIQGERSDAFRIELGEIESIQAEQPDGFSAWDNDGTVPDAIIDVDFQAMPELDANAAGTPDYGNWHAAVDAVHRC